MKTKFVRDVEDELLDLVDDQGNVLEVVLRSEAFKRKVKNFKIVLAIPSDVSGRLCVGRRALHKKWNPGALSFAGGCVRSGETYEQALVRELEEELSLDLRCNNYSCLAELTPGRDNFPAYTGVYKVDIPSANDIIFNEDDFSEILWLRPDELYAALEKGDCACRNLPILLEKFFPRP